MRALLLAAGMAVVASTSAMAVETSYPRTYTAEDCQDLNSQISDSMQNSKVDGSLAAMVHSQLDRANRACNGGQYGPGTRQLRDILDEIIATRGDH
jgi:hypothetical protein